MAKVTTAPVEGLYGPEFTFTLNGNVPDEHKTFYTQHLRNHLVTNQPEGAKFTETVVNYSNTKFTSPNGWWFEVTTNPGVLEIKMSPLTLADTKRFKADIQDAIFVSAANVGLFPWDYLGGGHLNFDVRIFNGSLLLARNFVVDFWNHNELSMGIFNYDNNNAMPMALYNDDEIEKIRSILEEVDSGKYSNDEEGIAKFFNALTSVLSAGKHRLGESTKGKHHDLNFSHGGRVEVRAVRPQANMDVWYNQIELIESRINNYLRHLDHPLPLRFHIPLLDPLDMSSAASSHRLVPPISPQKALLSFYAYVTKSGLQWKDHRTYVWPPWFRDGELEKFESSSEFKIRERIVSLKERFLGKRSCENLLK